VAMKANDFLNTLGAGTHLIQGLETPAAIIAGLKYTGIATSVRTRPAIPRKSRSYAPYTKRRVLWWSSCRS